MVSSSSLEQRAKCWKRMETWQILATLRCGITVPKKDGIAKSNWNRGMVVWLSKLHKLWGSSNAHLFFVAALVAHFCSDLTTKSELIVYRFTIFVRFWKNWHQRRRWRERDTPVCRFCDFVAQSASMSQTIALLLLEELSGWHGFVGIERHPSQIPLFDNGKRLHVEYLLLYRDSDHIHP